MGTARQTDGIVDLRPPPDTHGSPTPRLDDSWRVILEAVLDGLGLRLGRHEEPLREELSELRLAFVEMSRRAERRPVDRSA
jgi:hypothetical protein